MARFGIPIVFGLMLLVCGLFAPIAFAQTRTFDLAAGDAATRLREWSAIAEVKIEAPALLLRGKRTKAVTGVMDAREALQQMIAQSGLEILADEGPTIRLGKENKALTEFLIVEPSPAQYAALHAYQQMVRLALKAVFEPGVVARIVAMPSRTPEHAAGVRLDQGQYSLVIAKSRVRVEKITTDRDITLCSVKVDPSLGRDLVKAWGEVIEPRIEWSGTGRNRTDYDIAVREDGSERQKLASNPVPPDPSAALASLADTMGDYCSRPTSARRNSLLMKVTALKTALARAAQPD